MTNAKRTGLLLALCFVFYVLFLPNAFAAQAQDYTLYGTVTFDGVQLIRTDTNYTVVGKVYSESDQNRTTPYYTATYTMGTFDYDGYYCIIQMNTDAAVTNRGHTGDIMVITVNDKVISAGDLIVGAPGATPEQNIAAFSHGDATKFVIINPTDGAVDADAAVTVTIELQDADGNKVLSDSSSQVTVHVDGDATIDGATSKQVTMANGQATVNGIDHTAETVNLTLTDSASTGYNVSSTQDILFDAGALATLIVSPDTHTLTADQTQTFTVTGMDDYGNTTSVGTITWSGGTSIGTINATSGLFDAAIVGTGTVTATSDLGGITDTSGTITVNPGTLATLTVSPNTVTLTTDQTQQFTVTGVDAHGNSASVGTVTWSGGTSIGTINATSGLFDATTVGVGTVTATSSIGGITDTSDTITVNTGVLATLTVIPDTATLTADQTQQFTVTGVDADGNIASVGTITWSGGAGIGTINAGTGLFNAATVGIGTVTATSDLGDITNNSGTITVAAGTLATLTVGPDTFALTADETRQFTVTGVDANGNATNTDSITWSVAGNIGTIDAATGLFDATTVGMGTITATNSIGNVTDTSDTITVTAGALATLMVSPDTADLTADDTQQFIVTGADADGNTADLGTITWSAAGEIGTIDISGFFDATTVGTGTVTAKSGHGPADSSGNITVSHGAAAKIDLLANPAQISSSDVSESTLTATIQDQHNNTVTSGADSTQGVSFAVTDNTYGDIKDRETTVAAVAGVASSHVVSKIHETEGSIPCTADAGALLQATVTVKTVLRRLVTIDIEIVAGGLASSASPKVGETVQFKATGTYDDESTDDITNSVTWNSSSDNIGTMNIGGLFNAVAEGSTNVTATLAGVTSNTVVMNVQAAELVVFDTTELPETIEAGETVDFGAVTSGGSGAGFTYTVDSQPTGDPGILTADGEFSVDETKSFAGVYVISATDNNSGASVNHTINVPMKLEPNSFVMREGADQTFTLRGAPNGTTFTLTQYDPDGKDVGDVEGYGESDNGDGMSPVEVFTYTPDDIDEIKSFTVKFVADTPDESLEDAGLHELESGIYRVIPVNTYSGYIQDSDGNGLNNAIVKLIAPASYAETQPFITITNDAEAKDGYFEFNLPDTGAAYTFIRTLNGYVAATFTSNDLAANATVTLIDAAVYIAGAVTPACAADVFVFYDDEQGNPVKIGSTTSAVDGSYRIDITEDPGATTYYVAASSPGFFGKSIDGQLSIDNADVTMVALGSENEVNAKFGGSSEVTTVAGQQVSIVEIPPVSVDISGGATSIIEIAVVTIVNEDSNNTSESGDLLYEIKAEDQNGDPVSSFIGDIIITLPFALSKVAYDDLESGRVLIRHADNSFNLIKNIGVTKVDSEAIIAVDYVGDGTLGLVTFKVKSLSVFGIGSSSSGGGSGGTSLSDNGDDDRCFIATSAYGSPFESHVKILRNFRDVYLLSNRLGHAFVDTYYKYSPDAAAFIADHEFLRAVVRVGLMPVVGISYAALHTTAAQKALIIFLMLSLLAGICLAVRRS